MTPVTPGASARPGDWLVNDAALPPEAAGVPPGFHPCGELAWADALPYRTFACYYGSGCPLEHQEGPRCAVRLYRRDGDDIP
jgi:hypothetical protein